MRHELALAILLWKFVRHSNKIPVAPKASHWMTDQTLEVAYTAMDLAKLADVKDEFFTAMSDFPILNIQVKQLEKWDIPESKTFNPSGTTNKKV